MKRFIPLVIAFAFLLSACDQQGPAVPETNQPSQASQSENSSDLALRVDPSEVSGMSNAKTKKGNGNTSNVSAYLQALNEDLAESGFNIAIQRAEWVTTEGAYEEEASQTVFANDRNKRLNSRWVPGDERREPGLDGNNITYLVDQSFSLANGSIDSEPAIDASFDTWDESTQCSNLPIVKLEDDGTNPSAVFAGGNPFVADIVESGFFPGFIFDILLGPGSSQRVLGVTFTSVFIDEDGNPTDINNDGRDDTAFKEVLYNDSFLWTTDPSAPGTDIETVALHENGHALEQGHFGKIFITGSNNKLHVSPRAVMNAIILGPQRTLLGTDNGGHCSNFGSWPNQ